MDTGDDLDVATEDGVGVCEDDEEVSGYAGMRIGQRDPTTEVMLSKESMAICGDGDEEGGEGSTVLS